MEKWQRLYRVGWVTKDQLKRAIVTGKMTAEEYEEITGGAPGELPEPPESLHKIVDIMLGGDAE